MAIKACPVHWLLQSADDMPSGDGWLSAAEAEQAAGFRFAKRRDEWRLGRWTAKQALGAYLSHGERVLPGELSPRVLEVHAAHDGAPEAYRDGSPLPVSVSISHRDGMALCAVAKAGVALGCDLEVIEPRSARFVADYLTDEEQLVVQQTPRAQHPLVVNALWSAKESALKALRTGLRRDTRTVSVRLLGEPMSQAWAPLAVTDREDGAQFGGWWCEQEGTVMTPASSPWPRQPAALAAWQMPHVLPAEQVAVSPSAPRLRHGENPT